MSDDLFADLKDLAVSGTRIDGHAILVIRRAAISLELSRVRIAELEASLRDCSRRLRSCAEVAGNSDDVVDGMLAQFDAVLARSTLSRGEKSDD